VFCDEARGTVYRAETFKAAVDAALAPAGITDYVRPFHDLRHTAITNDAGSTANAVTAKAGHRNMATTRTYLYLAGTVFREEAERLERSSSGIQFCTHLSTPQPTGQRPKRLRTWPNSVRDQLF
jgi:hypothetical protein